jgi:EAL domain-containing protein (putative c-di-GMP-specific phosphodiesterase class I)
MIGHCLLAVYQVTNEFTSFQANRIESSIIDHLKRKFSNLPYEVYARRYSAFKENLHQLVFYFEPVVHIGKKALEIESWEALARDPQLNRAPHELFLAAELWGPQFTTELDLFCLRNALTTYTSIWRKERGGQKYDPISVNVYPETLFRSSYKKELHELLKVEGLLFGDKLILEISEKRPLPRPDDEIPSYFDNLVLFEQKLKELSKEFNISFAIDDFGVEHSSISRTAHLELAHVKVDRDILLHPFPGKTFKYVRELVGESHSHSIKVIVEGFDENIHNISLSELYNIGIEYIQGHLIKRASPNVSDLNPEKVDLLLKLINGQ